MERDSEIDESIDINNITFDETSFTWGVDSATRSKTSSVLGASLVRSFASIVDSTIMSGTASNLGSSPLHSFGSIVDYAIMSDTASNFGASPIHGFASTVDRRNIASRLSRVVSNPTGHVIAPLFTLAELVAATNNFSLENKIGAGRFGVVYRGILVDGREVAIKRDETSSRTNFELDFLSGLRHNNLVGLVGLCEGKDERLLVYEYMRNGALFDHLHDKGNSVLNSWKLRIKVALDACRGIEYLHNYTIPSIIHRNIKSSNIFLDATHTARLSDFELSFMSQEPDYDCRDTVVGTFGYIDPEYLRRGVVTTKSDVYGLGVVMLELLTGKRPIFMSGEYGCSPLSVVDLAVPATSAGYLVKILDPSVGPPDVNEEEALKLVAYTAIHCVNLKGKDRPTMTDIVLNLERALDICYSSPHDSIFSTTISHPSTGTRRTLWSTSRSQLLEL